MTLCFCAQASKGDAFLLTGDHDHKTETMLIDCGYGSTYTDKMEPVAMRRGGYNLTSACCTHYDGDHIKGMIKFLEGLKDPNGPFTGTYTAGKSFYFNPPGLQASRLSLFDADDRQRALSSSGPVSQSPSGLSESGSTVSSSKSVGPQLQAADATTPGTRGTHNEPLDLPDKELAPSGAWTLERVGSPAESSPVTPFAIPLADVAALPRLGDALLIAGTAPLVPLFAPASVTDAKGLVNAIKARNLAPKSIRVKDDVDPWTSQNGLHSVYLPDSALSTSNSVDVVFMGPTESNYDAVKGGGREATDGIKVNRTSTILWAKLGSTEALFTGDAHDRTLAMDIRYSATAERHFTVIKLSFWTSEDGQHSGEH